MNKLVLKISALLFSGILLFSCGGSSLGDNVKSGIEMDFGVNAFSKGKYKEAMEHFLNAKKDNPHYDSIASMWVHGCELGKQMDSVLRISDTMMVSLAAYEKDWNKVNDDPDQDWGCFLGDCDKGGIYFSSKAIYRGNRANDMKNGYGEVLYVKGTRCVAWGNWVDGKMEGPGAVFFDGDDKGQGYYGNWVNDREEGKGVIVYPSHSIREASYVNDSCEGSGTRYIADGTIMKGTWKHDHMEGQFKVYDRNGNSWNEVWSAGKFISSDKKQD